MTKQDRKKLNVLVVLLVVLGLTLVLGYRMNRPQTTAAVQPVEAKTSANPPAANDARIRLDLVEKAEAAGDIGRNNVFQYRQAPAPVAANRGSSATTPAASQPQPVVTAPPVQIRPAGPPPPPPITLKYQGFAVVNSETGNLTAFIADESRHYNATVGEVLMGKYRITQISDKAIEVEDLPNNRRQMIPLTK